MLDLFLKGWPACVVGRLPGSPAQDGVSCGSAAQLCLEKPLREGEGRSEDVVPGDLTPAPSHAAEEL